MSYSNDVPRAFIRPTPKPPCHGCQIREVGCHGSCELYKQFVEHRHELVVKQYEAYGGQRLAENCGREKRMKRMLENQRKWRK